MQITAICSKKWLWEHSIPVSYIYFGFFIFHRDLFLPINTASIDELVNHNILRGTVPFKCYMTTTMNRPFVWSLILLGHVWYEGSQVERKGGVEVQWEVGWEGLQNGWKENLLLVNLQQIFNHMFKTSYYNLRGGTIVFPTRAQLDFLPFFPFPFKGYCNVL